VKKPQRFLEEALQAAHRDIHQYRHAHKLPETPRTTIVACLIQHNTATWAHCGDSRLYWMRNGQILGRTRDHSHVENLIAKGMALPSERATHPDRNKLWNCLGADSLPRVEVGAGAGCCRAIWCCCVPTVCGLCCRTMKWCAACRRKPWCARCRTCCKPRCVQRATPATTSRRWPSCGRAVRCWIMDPVTETMISTEAPEDLHSTTIRDTAPPPSELRRPKPTPSMTTKLKKPSRRSAVRSKNLQILK
jgi:protein phosphatase